MLQLLAPLFVVSIHAPLARRDEIRHAFPDFPELFQFTRLLRGATLFRFQVLDRVVSIHAPLARRDWRRRSRCGSRASFNSRASCEARPTASVCPAPARVSIHAPLARRDRVHRANMFADKVSIHAPLARRDFSPCRSTGSRSFNSRASCEARLPPRSPSR